MYTPDGETVYVADATVLDNGWVSVIRWDDSRAKFAPQAVWKIERPDIESTTQNQQATIGVADGEFLEEARRLAQPTEADAGEQEAVADD